MKPVEKASLQRIMSLLALAMMLWVGGRRLWNALRSRGITMPSRTRTAWIINQYAIPPDFAGSTRHYELAVMFSKLGWNSVIFATPFSHKEGQYVRPVRLHRPVLHRPEAGVDFVWLYSSPYEGNDWRRYANMVTFAATCVLAGMARPRPDVIIGSSPHLLSGLAAWLLAKWHRVAFVLEVRDLWPESLVDLGLTNPLVIGPLAALKRHLYRSADHIIPLSEGIRDAIRESGVPDRKLTLVPNAASEVTRLTGDEREAIRKQHRWGDKSVFIYVGAHGVANSLDTIVEAAKLLSDNEDVYFVMVGDGPEKVELKRQASGLNNIQFLDAVQKSDVHKLLEAADVGMLTLRKSKVFEGVRPNKLFDYMAAGLPMITSVPGETRNLVEEAGAGVFVPPENPHRFAETALSLVESAEYRARLAACATEFGNAMPTRQQTARWFVDVLNDQVAPQHR